MTGGLDLAPGTIIGARYRLERPLARGGMGAVWVARHIELGTAVAVKFMDPTFAASPGMQARFAREAKASASLGGKHVVEVRDYGVDGSTPYLVMELLRGEDLGAKLLREHRLSVQATAVILFQAAKGLRRAHEAGVVHRDLKPGNIFLARTEDDEEVVKILDFGIAKETATQLVGDTTRTGEVVGSPHYMSPEQIRGAKDLDVRSDVWSLGVITFRMLTGRLPFAGEVMGDVLGQILADVPPVASQVAPDLPREIDVFFERTLTRDRSRRFASAVDMAAALNAIAGGPNAAWAAGLSISADVSSAAVALNVAAPPAAGGKTLIMPGAAPTAATTPPSTLTGAGGAITSPRPARTTPVLLILGAIGAAILIAAAILVMGRRGAEPEKLSAAPSDPARASGSPTVAATAKASQQPIEIALPEPAATTSVIPAPYPRAPATAPSASADAKRARPGGDLVDPWGGATATAVSPKPASTPAAPAAPPVKSSKPRDAPPAKTSELPPSGI